MMQVALQLLLLAAGIYALVVGLVFLGQRRLMYHPGGVAGAPADAGLPTARALRVATADGLVLLSWYLAPTPGRPVVLYLHGNAGTIADRAHKARLLADQGIGVMLAEYRGYGGNPGHPTEAGLYADARANLAWLADQGHGAGDTVVYGESLGTGVAVQMVLELAEAGTPARALVLEAPFTAMADAAGVHYPWLPTGLLTRDRYDSSAKIGAVRCPVLVIHGDRDRVVPQDQGKRLFALAAAPKTAAWLPGAGHGDVYDFGAGEAVLDFLVTPPGESGGHPSGR
ncbi:MAG: alpha/beta hydrolase [Rhodospirillales bacterium]|tara:strand:- start:837 stop:1688 length:852 start_codon:yes stop_codon:yes gene_type:complete